MLEESQYEALRDQLANMAAAKASGNFVFQVAASVEALVNCSESVTTQAMREFKEKRDSITNKVGRSLLQLVFASYFTRKRRNAILYRGLIILLV